MTGQAGLPTETQRFRFENLLLDVGQQRLWRGDVEIQLPKLSFDLLLTLIRAAPNLVSNDDLMERVWPGLVVSPETVSQRVKLLRDALGDDAHKPRYIASARGRGYRFVADVHTSAEPDDRVIRPPGDEASEAFVQRVPPASSEPLPVLAGTRSATLRHASGVRTASTLLSRKGMLLLVTAIALIGVGYLAVNKLAPLKPAPSVQPAAALVQPSRSVQVTVPEQSIAVLPFVNMSPDKDQEYFSDGLTEEMIDLLGQVPGLRVPARTSSFYFKGKNEPIANIAQQLRVANVLEGSVRKSGKRLRITAQLIRADSGYHLWSQSYDRNDNDIFAVQDDIAKAVVSALQVTLAAGAQSSTVRGTNSAEAFNQFLLGRQLYRRGGVVPTRHAIEAFRQAVARDPNYAEAHAELALAEAAVGDYTGDRSSIDRAAVHADRAVELAPNSASVYAARGALRAEWLWDWSGAQADIRKALDLGPRDSDVQLRYAHLLETLGRLPEAIAAQMTATALDPLSGSAWRNLGSIYFESKDYAAADVALAHALQIEPTAEEGLFYLGQLRLLQGNAQGALEEFRKINDDSLRPTGIAMAEHTLGHVNESQQALDEVIASHAQDYAYQIAEVYAWRGDGEQAFAWLDRAYRQRDGGLSLVKIDPMLDSLRADARFMTLVRNMQLPE